MNYHDRNRTTFYIIHWTYLHVQRHGRKVDARRDISTPVSHPLVHPVAVETHVVQWTVFKQRDMAANDVTGLVRLPIVVHTLTFVGLGAYRGSFCMYKWVKRLGKSTGRLCNGVNSRNKRNGTHHNCLGTHSYTGQIPPVPAVHPVELTNQSECVDSVSLRGQFRCCLSHFLRQRKHLQQILVPNAAGSLLQSSMSLWTRRG